MKTLILILIILSFLQATILPINLVLIILVCRSFIKPGKNNLYFAFGFGILHSILFVSPVGVESIIYLVSVEVVQIASKSRLANFPVLIIPFCLIFLFADSILLTLLNHTSGLETKNIIIGAFLSLPVFFITRLWEERFIVRSDIRLKI